MNDVFWGFVLTAAMASIATSFYLLDKFTTIAGRRIHNHFNQPGKSKPTLLRDVAKFRQSYAEILKMADKSAEWRLSPAAYYVAMSDENFITRDSILNKIADGWMFGAPVFIDEKLGDGVGELIGKAGNRVTFQVSPIRPYRAGK